MSNNYSNGRAGAESLGSFTPDNLIAGDENIRTRKVTFRPTVGGLLRGALLGIIASGLKEAAVANGVPFAGAATLGTLSAAAAAQVGVHRIVNVVAGSGNAAKWNHYAPDGTFVGTVTSTVAYTGGGLTFTIADPGTDPVLGDTFNVTVTLDADEQDDVGVAKLSLAAAVDGSQVPMLILAEDVPDLEVDYEAVAYEMGDFNEWRIIYGTGHTANSVREGLREKNIILHNAVRAVAGN